MTVEIKDCKLSIWQRVSGFRWVGFGLLVRERCLFKMQLPRSGNKPLGACARETLALQSLTPMPGGSTANVAFWTEKKLASNAAARLRKRVPRRALPPCPWRTDQVLKWLACAREVLASQSLAPMPWRTDKVLRWEAPVPNIVFWTEKKLASNLATSDKTLATQLYLHASEGRTRCSAGKLPGKSSA